MDEMPRVYSEFEKQMAHNLASVRVRQLSTEKLDMEDFNQVIDVYRNYYDLILASLDN